MKLKLLVLAVLTGFLSHSQVTYWEKSVVKNYEDGINLFDKKLFAAASDKFRNVLNVVDDTKNEIYVGAEYHQAMCAIYLFNKDAEYLVDQFIKNHPTSPKVQDALYNTANFMFTSRKYRQAAQWLEKIDEHQLDADQKEGYHFKYGYSLFAKKQNEAAKDHFYQIKEGKTTYAVSAKYYYAHIAYLDSNYVTALENFEALLDDKNFGQVVPYYLAQIYYQTEDFDKLIRTGEKLINNTEAKRKAEIAKLVGDAYFQKKDYPKALHYFEISRKNKGKMLQGDFYAMGYCYYKTEQFEKALTAFNKITTARGEVGQNAYYHLGDCYLKIGNKQEAMSAFKAAAEMKNGVPAITESASFNYAKLNYELANPYEDAIKALKRFLKDYPNSINKTDANRYLANLYITTKDYENALKAISQSGLNTPEMKEAYQKVSYFRGVEYYNALNPAKALEYFDLSLKYPINNTYIALAHFWSAESYFKQKKYDDALNSYWAFQQTPGASKLSEFNLSQYNKGYCFFMKEDYENARYAFRLFEDSKNKNQRLNDDGALRLGDCYFMTNKYDQAISYYNKVAGSKKTDADYAQFQKALCYGLAGNDNKKISALNQLVKQYPNSNYLVESRYELASTSLRMDNNQAALNYFEDFLTHHPNSKLSPRAQLNKGVVYRNLSQYDNSINTFKAVVEKYPSTTEAYEAISFAKLVYAKANRIDEYVDWVSDISFADVNRNSLDSTVYTTAYDQYGMGNCPEAIKGFETYLSKFADGLFVLKAQNYIAECSYLAKDDVKAEQYYKLVVAHPNNNYTEIALVRLASINYAEEEYEEALVFYEKLASQAEDVNNLRKAYEGILQCANILQQLDKVIQYADIIIEDDKFEPETRNEALLYKARAYYAQEKATQAWQAFTELKEVAQGAPKAEATYHIAYFESLDDQHEESNKTIFWMIDNLPSYAKWRYKALIILAENYWKLDDAFQANYTLDFIIGENYNEEIVNQAKVLKEEIRRDEEQKKLEQEKSEAEEAVEINLNNEENAEENTEEDVKGEMMETETEEPMEEAPVEQEEEKEEPENTQND